MSESHLRVDLASKQGSSQGDQDETRQRLLHVVRVRVIQSPLWVVSAAILAAGVIRYVQQPSFWLDEAFVAISVRNPSFATIFGRLEYAQYFPRGYLFAIALLREILGYRIWAVRLLPFLAFLAATLLWSRLLAPAARSMIILAFLGAGLLLGAGFWLDQAIQLKQYTLDVLLALIPFILPDDVFRRSLVQGEKRAILCALAAPCLFSYTYPFALGARLIGWYVYHARRDGWRVNTAASLVLMVAVAVCLVGIWITDYRYNLADRPAYLLYWNDCILRPVLQQGPQNTLRLLAKFLWGWHGRQPLVTAGMIPLQILGVGSVFSQWRNRKSTDHCSWGSRSIGSVLLLVAMILASVLLSYPICAGRTVLFAQVHTQILAIEGGLFVMLRWKNRKAAMAFILTFTSIVIFHSGRNYVRFIRSESPENIRPMLGAMESGDARAVWVSSCSVAQVRTLPDPLPVERPAPWTLLSVMRAEPDMLPVHPVRLGARDHPKRGERVFVLWTHLGDEYCLNELQELRRTAVSWKIIREGTDSGLALAEF